MDEARRKGIDVDTRSLSRDLGVPVVPIVARTGEGMHALLDRRRRRLEWRHPDDAAARDRHAGVRARRPRADGRSKRRRPGVPNAAGSRSACSTATRASKRPCVRANWRALVSRQQQRDARSAARSPCRERSENAECRECRECREWGATVMTTDTRPPSPDAVLARARELRRQLSGGFRDEAVKSLYAEAERVAQRAVSHGGDARRSTSTSESTGSSPRRLRPADHAADPGRRVLADHRRRQRAVGDAGRRPSSGSRIRPSRCSTPSGVPWWITGFLWHGVYRGLAWVVSVMLPPMAIFFPLFTILEDLGYLPRVAFNLDLPVPKSRARTANRRSRWRWASAATRPASSPRVIIDSPRERLIAILTNNFVPCNGRFPTLIMLPRSSSAPPSRRPSPRSPRRARSSAWC